MRLVEMWKREQAQLVDKLVKQIVVFAGDGKLTDDSPASAEFREYLQIIPSDLLEAYAEQCLSEPFENSGLALQDVVNEIGRRLGFRVEPGRYRGSVNQSGHDGIWNDEAEFAIIVEVKTTDAYRITLDTIARYRRTLANEGRIELESSSMLIVVGRQDTGDLEAQIRGSRHAWEMRLISVDALVRMLHLKEEVEDPAIVTRIHQILMPREFTRLDQIVDVAFAAVRDVQESTEEEEETELDEDDAKAFTPVAFHAECIRRIERSLGVTLVKQSRASYVSPDRATRLVCSVSRFHEVEKRFWFAFQAHQRTFLSEGAASYVAFGCGSPSTLFLIPFKDFNAWLEHFNKTERRNGYYWHVKIAETDGTAMMKGRRGAKDFLLTPYLLPE